MPYPDGDTNAYQCLIYLNESGITYSSTQSLDSGSADDILLPGLWTTGFMGYRSLYPPTLVATAISTTMMI